MKIVRRTPRRRATMSDVAREAGVSVATVSAVINQNKYVSPELTARVEEAMASLQYTPNAIARSLKERQTHTLGVIIPSIDSPFWPLVVRGIQDLAFAQRYNILLLSADRSPERERECLQILVRQRADGIILSPSDPANADYVNAIIDRGAVVVQIDGVLAHVKADAVLLDNHTATHEVVAHLVSHGYRRIALLNLATEATSFAERQKGYFTAMQAHGLQPEVLQLPSQGLKPEMAQSLLVEFLQRPSPPRALFATNHLLSVVALSAACQLSLHVPDQLAIFGFDDFYWTPRLNPSLSTVEQPAYQIGTIALQMLLERISGQRDEPPQVVRLAPKLLLRGSCGCATRYDNPG